MLNISGSVYDNSEIDTPDFEHPLAVTSCGHYKLIKKESLSTYRPAGRKDFQLLYIANGKTQFLIHGESQTVTQGHIVFYYPFECQKYEYRLCDLPEVYWLHFSGSGAEDILSQLELSPQRVFKAGSNTVYVSLFDHIIQELQLKRTHYKELCNTYFYELLTLMSRNTLEGGTGAYPHNEQVRLAVQLFHNRYSEPFHLEQYARQYHMSPCWFARIFRQETGTSPVKYLTDIRINKAKELLASSSYNIGEIADMVGYSNPLYFSRIFKKYSGRTPSEYRTSSR